MPLRDAPTPSPAELDTLATAARGDDVDQRARDQWRRDVQPVYKRLLDATTDDAGPATGPVNV
jgi:hypothetical protein